MTDGGGFSSAMSITKILKLWHNHVPDWRFLNSINQKG